MDDECSAQFSGLIEGRAFAIEALARLGLTHREVVCLYAVRMEGRTFSAAGREVGLSRDVVRRAVRSAEVKLADRGMSPRWPVAKAAREPLSYHDFAEIAEQQSYNSGDDEPCD